ncbi:hypothetical protein BCR44DRAFT_1427814 [Catenaria anguillulae PL171]|uniref:Uncharacterized protein n=1 Tax=Catenaria anguillulae PL171 TaxID=765915 RepID=A0A1Y2HW29_9FUNG|nr:hypothetical protein BCR44DRAFT_1427814 [Catenaria anguillulae PL171]
MGYDETTIRSSAATRRPNPSPTRQPSRPSLSPQPSYFPVPSRVPGPPSDRPAIPPLIPPVVYRPAPPNKPESSPKSGISSSDGVSSQGSTTEGEDSATGAREAVAPIPSPIDSSVQLLQQAYPRQRTPPLATLGQVPSPHPLFTLPIVVGSLAIVAVSLAVVFAVMRRMRSAKGEQAPNARSADPSSTSVPSTDGGNQQQGPSASPRPSVSVTTREAADVASANMPAPQPTSVAYSHPTPLGPSSAASPVPDSPPNSPTPLSRTTALGTAASTSAALRASLATTNRSRSDVGSVPGTQYSPTLYAQKLGPARRGSRESIVSASSGTLYYANSRAASTTTVSPTDGSGGVLSDAMSVSGTGANVVSPPLPPMSPVATSPALWRLSMGSGFEQQQSQAQMQSEPATAAPWPPLPRTVTLEHLDVAPAAVSTAPPLTPGAEVTSEELSTWVRTTFRTDFDTLEHGSIAGSIRGLRGLRDTMGGSDLSGSGSGMYGSDDDEDGGGGSILSVPGTPLTDAFSTGSGSGFPSAVRRVGPPHGLSVQGHSHSLAHSQPLSPLTLVEFAPSEEEASVHSGSVEAQRDHDRVGRAA